MSVLSKKHILERIAKGDIKIEPGLDKFQIQAHAIDLRLGYTYMVPKRWHLTEKGREVFHIDHFNKDQKDHFDIVELEKGQFFELLPGEFVLASTLETVSWPDDLMSVLYPRSSTNRRGLSVDLTGIVDAGYEGQLIIPIRNNTSSQSIRIYPGERFCQITFESLSEPSGKPDGTYHQKDVIEGFILKQKNDEIKLIQKGEVPELKEKYGVDPAKEAGSGK
jgi:dCTP deaminase